MSDVEERVIKIVASELSIDKKKVVPTANFVDNLGSDSLDAAELLMALEEEFDIEIPDEDAKLIITVQAAIDYIEDKKE